MASPVDTGLQYPRSRTPRGSPPAHAPPPALAEHRLHVQYGFIEKAKAASLCCTNCVKCVS